MILARHFSAGSSAELSVQSAKRTTENSDYLIRPFHLLGIFSAYKSQH